MLKIWKSSRPQAEKKWTFFADFKGETVKSGPKRGSNFCKNKREMTKLSEKICKNKREMLRI